MAVKTAPLINWTACNAASPWILAGINDVLCYHATPIHNNNDNWVDLQAIREYFALKNNSPYGT